MDGRRLLRICDAPPSGKRIVIGRSRHRDGMALPRAVGVTARRLGILAHMAEVRSVHSSG